MEHCGLIIPFWEKALISDTKNPEDHLLELMHVDTRDFLLSHLHQRLHSKIWVKSRTNHFAASHKIKESPGKKTREIK